MLPIGNKDRYIFLIIQIPLLKYFHIFAIVNILTINDMKRLLLVLCVILSQCSCKKDSSELFKTYYGSAQINEVYYEDNVSFEKQAKKNMYLPFGGARFVCRPNTKGLNTFFLQLDLFNPKDELDRFIMMATFPLLEGEKFPEISKKYDIVYCQRLDGIFHSFIQLPYEEWFHDATYSLRDNYPSIVGVVTMHSFQFNDALFASTQGYIVFDKQSIYEDGTCKYIGKFVLSNAPESICPNLRIEGDFKVYLTEK